MSGRTVLITGATSGIGRATAIALAAAGARLILAVRDTAKGEALARELGGKHEVRALDLADLASVRRFAQSTAEPIDTLVNNAGVASSTLQRTTDGFELQFGTNHLGHFLLTTLLLPQIAARVVTVASQAERASRLDLEDLNWEQRDFRAGRAYADSKLANLLFTAELDRRLRAAGSPVQAMAAHPGLVVTAIYDDPQRRRASVWDRLLPLAGQQPAQGALPVLLAVTGDLPDATFTGPRHLMHMRGGAQVIGRSRRAKDPVLSRRLWTASEQLTAQGTAAPRDPAHK
ncbi:SDR family NAD(P)-dependent oxidoreductase [Arthrobacter gandavensis]|uniref:SDR family NAD(P)-dependent oxidoreductase n=1 Tax=Arthrobacter gandavensis TaxID=169960 RepID=UPI00188F6079|nr:SDR family NAD(P)-dependent oxidoreductase [Arthrobacter gandavensis]MBF4993279.1 SDR family NAD(P)-dependent oxidoreductase [Arthrobacter gandavensis]